MVPLMRLRPGVEDIVLLSGLGFCMELGFLSGGIPEWKCPHSRLAPTSVATEGSMRMHTHCKEQMMEVQAVPILKCPMHVLCPHT